MATNAYGYPIPTQFNPTNTTITLGRLATSKINFASFDPEDWKSYVQFGGLNDYSNTEFAFLKASFISLDDEKKQADILIAVQRFYYHQVVNFHRNGSAEKRAAEITNQNTKNLSDFVIMRYKSYKEFADKKTGTINQYIAEAKNGEFKLNGGRAEVSTRIAQNEIQRFITTNPYFTANAQVAQGFLSLFSGLANTAKVINQKIEDARDDIKNELNTGIAGITAEVVSAKDLLKARAQLFTPEQLADPKVQKMLREQAESDARLEIEKAKQLQELNRALRKDGIFDPLVSAVTDPSLPAQMKFMDSVAKSMMPAAGSINQSKFVGPRIKPTDSNLNSPLQLIKDEQNAANLAEAAKKKIGRPVGSTKIAKLNGFVEQRSINRIKSFMNPDLPPEKMKKVDLPKENFKFLDPNLAYAPTDYKDKFKSFKDIDPNISRDEKVDLMRTMMFKPYG